MKRKLLMGFFFLAVFGVYPAAYSARQQAVSPAANQSAVPSYSIDAIRFATIPKFPLSGLIPSAPRDQQIDIAMVIWLIRGGGRTILFDSGFHRDKWFNQFNVTDFLSPDKAVQLAGVDPSQVTTSSSATRTGTTWTASTFFQTP
jgi:hypothetical protein